MWLVRAKTKVMQTNLFEKRVSALRMLSRDVPFWVWTLIPNPNPCPQLKIWPRAKSYLKGRGYNVTGLKVQFPSKVKSLLRAWEDEILERLQAINLVSLYTLTNLRLIPHVQPRGIFLTPSARIINATFLGGTKFTFNFSLPGIWH
jgi:hypothetical protein